MPEEIIKRSNEILRLYEETSKEKQMTRGEQVSFDFDTQEQTNNEVLERLNEIDPLKTTPIDAINILYELKELSKK